MSAPKTCPNCLSTIHETDLYCAQCSQSTHLHRFSLPHIGHEFFHAFTHADKGVLFLIKELTLRPGVVAREYILEGKRKKYFNPFTFLLLVLGLSVLANSYFKPYGPPVASSSTSSPPTTTVKPRDLGVQQRKQVVFSMLNKKANLVAFAALPIFALVFWLFFIRRGINYAEHLVANVLFASYFQLVAAILSALLSLLHQTDLFTTIQLFFQLLYLPFAYYQFINYRRPVSFLLPLFATILAIGSWGVVSFLVIRFYIAYGFSGS